VQLKTFGDPEEVVDVVDLPDLAISASDQILVRVLFAPIGPADIGTFWGRYPRQDPKSVVPGVEAIGVVEGLGADVPDLEVGDRVLVLPVDNWSQQLLLTRNQVARVSKEGDIFQQFTLKSNGATAALLLRNFADLQPGDWVAQNGANSTVGQYIVQIARARGLRTINIVRNATAAEHLRKLGADVVAIAGENLVAEIGDATGGATVRLAIDCVGGESSADLAAILGPRGILVNYGGLSGQPVQIHPLQLITADIQVRGFWITRWFLQAPHAEVQALIDELDAMVSAGELVTEVASVHPLSDIKTALRRAGSGGRNGKVLLDFRMT